jgi:type I restriction enzyme S subunit
MTRANTASLAGAVALVRHTPPALMLCDKTWRLVPNEKLIRRDFLLHSLRGRHARRFLELEATGSSGSMKNISQASLRALRLPVPPLEEQQVIADVGEAFDQRIIDETRVLDQLREVKHGLAQALLTGRVRVPMTGPSDGAAGGP